MTLRQVLPPLPIGSANRYDRRHATKTVLATMIPPGLAAERPYRYRLLGILRWVMVVIFDHAQRLHGSTPKGRSEGTHTNMSWKTMRTTRLRPSKRSERQSIGRDIRGMPLLSLRSGT